MKLDHSFTVPVDADVAFRILRDVETVASCMPGAVLESSDGARFSGKIKMKVGPIQVTYRGEAAFTEVDESARTATIVAEGKEARGSGTARATIDVQLEAAGGSTTVVVTTDLEVTGKPAQFGRGVMDDVGEKLVNRFADCLEQRIDAADAEREAPAVAPAPPSSAPPLRQVEAEAAEAIDLPKVAGGSGAPAVVRAVAPVAVGITILALIAWLIRRR